MYFLNPNSLEEIAEWEHVWGRKGWGRRGRARVFPGQPGDSIS